jgi:hypothetical protein
MKKHIFLDYITQLENQLYFLNENQMIYVQMYLAYMQDSYGEQIQMHNIF